MKKIKNIASHKLNFPLVSLSFCRTELVKIKRRALRYGIWFKVLSRTERVQMDLTIKVVDKVRSAFLAKVLHPIVTKLLNATESPVRRLMRKPGIGLARKLSEMGKKLGCKSAEEWANDSRFIQFLTVMYMNTPGLYKV